MSRLCEAIAVRCVIRAVDNVHVSYIGLPSSLGFRRLVERHEAAIFDTPDEARQAIIALPEGVTIAGLRFSIEKIDAV